MIEVLIVIGMLVVLALTAYLLDRRQASRLNRIALEEQLAAWRMSQVIMEARRQMRAAARGRGRS